MERSEHAAIKIEATAPQSVCASAASSAANAWWLFCALVLAIKLLLLWLDPTPKLFMGDSWTYIWTALSGWIPGVLLRLPGTWTLALATQFYSAFSDSGARQRRNSDRVCVDCSRFFEMSTSLWFLFGLLCALDPCQLVWEGYVMTETFSLLVYVLVLYWSLAYLRNRRLWQLAVVQALSVLLIAFRMSYLLVFRPAPFYCHSLRLHVVPFRCYASGWSSAHWERAF